MACLIPATGIRAERQQGMECFRFISTTTCVISAVNTDGTITFSNQAVSATGILQRATELAGGGNWTDYVQCVVTGGTMALCVFSPNPPSGMVLVPAGNFQIGDAVGEGYPVERPVHDVYVSAFFMDKFEVTKALWDEVATWAATNGYDIGATDGVGKAMSHPVQDVTWFECVKWCNARSEKEGRRPAYYISTTNRTPAAVYRTGQKSSMGNDWVLWRGGYRLPTEAEREKASRGGAEGRRFSWSDSDTIQHARANYQATQIEAYDTSPTRGHHPTYKDGVKPYTSPVGSFAPNGYGLFDMTGNVWEWCWDLLDSNYYSCAASMYDPQGPTSGTHRVFRGGSWDSHANGSRAAWRYYFLPTSRSYYTGFRTVLPVGR